MRHLSWTNHLSILCQRKRQEKRDFYIDLAIRKRWSSR
ncbi:hypothetical protein [Beijerinckia indica]